MCLGSPQSWAVAPIRANLIFDNRVLWSHRAMAGVLGVILKLPPIKQVMASKQVKSRYLEQLIDYVEH